MKTYEILVLDDYGNIIHRHYYEALSIEDAQQNAVASRKWHNGSKSQIIEIKG